MPGTGHSGDGITTGRLRRVGPLAGVAARTAGEAVIASLRRRPVEAEKYAERAERYVEVMGQSKGALMKIGQILSFVHFNGAVPPENRAIFQAAMARLQADAPPMAPELAAEVVEAELGAPPSELFSEFSPLPLAAASIGQVHRARLADGRAVAVKVQYPGVADAIRADLRNVELVAVTFQLMRSLIPGLTRTDPQAVAEEISERIGDELDYCVEASNQKLFADSFAGHPFIQVPAVIDELSTRRVLTQELAEGWRWSEAVTKPQEMRDRWGEAIFRFVFGSLRRLCAFNADPHPGNYLFRPDGTVSFLDFGCVKRFSRQDVTQMQDIVRSAINGDAVALRAAFVDVGVFDPVGPPRAEEVLEWYRPSFAMITAPQPCTMTPEMVCDLVRHEMTFKGPSGKILRFADMPKNFVLLSRIDLGLMSVLAELRASGDWRSIQAELDDGAAPVTVMGTAEAQFLAGSAPRSATSS